MTHNQFVTKEIKEKLLSYIEAELKANPEYNCLVWRQLPDCIKVTEKEKDLYYCYSRLLLTKRMPKFKVGDKVFYQATGRIKRSTILEILPPGSTRRGAKSYLRYVIKSERGYILENKLFRTKKEGEMAEWLKAADCKSVLRGT